ncbi:MAG: hypothetical protein MJA83_11315 [Gammaproteobacteria bacterium]|nr:hypothetical protein [Gammaproteobacteria bacterium]
MSVKIKLPMRLDVSKAATQYIKEFMRRHGFEISESSANSMGEWSVCMENGEFFLFVSRDRGGYESIEISAKSRSRKGAHLRTWSLSKLRGYLEDLDNHYRFHSLKEQADWLQSHEEELLNTAFLNSENLRKWNTKVSRDMFR